MAFYNRYSKNPTVKRTLKKKGKTTILFFKKIVIFAEQKDEDTLPYYISVK